MINMLVFWETTQDRVYPPGLERISFFRDAGASLYGGFLNSASKNCCFSSREKDSTKKPGPFLIPATRFV